MSKKKKYLHKLEKEWKKASTLSNTAELAETQNIATDSLLPWSKFKCRFCNIKFCVSVQNNRLLTYEHFKEIWRDEDYKGDGEVFIRRW